MTDDWPAALKPEGPELERVARSMTRKAVAELDLGTARGALLEKIQRAMANEYGEGFNAAVRALLSTGDSDR